MKKFLLLALCFFAAQINSCSLGIEVQADVTKFTILNDSKVLLKEVTWNGTDFGDIEPGMASTREIAKWDSSEASFKIYGKEYKTNNKLAGKEFRHIKHTFNDETSVINAENNILLGDIASDVTKFTMNNKSSITLKNVYWNKINFGDIGPNMSSTREISEWGYSEALFKVNGEEYKTYDFFAGKEFNTIEYSFSNETTILSSDGKINRLGAL